MLLSSTLLNTNYTRFKKNREKNKLKEGYNIGQSSLAGISASMDSFLLVVAVLFFILEFFLLFYALSIALKCSKPGPQRVVHIFLAITFTIPYMLFSVFFSKCSQDLLENSDIFMSPLNEKRVYYKGSSMKPSGLSFL